MGLFDSWRQPDAQFSQSVLDIGGSQSSKKSYTYSPSTSNVYSSATTTTDARVFAPSYSVILDSPNAGITKKDSITSSPRAETSPELSASSVASPSTTQRSTGSSGASLLGGSAGTLIVLGGIGVAGYILIKRFGGK